MVSGNVPLLVRVALSGEPVVPSSCVGKVMGAVSEKVTTPVLSSVITASPS